MPKRPPRFRPSRWRIAAVAIGFSGALAVAAPAPAVELELVLAIDASTSVDFREFNLQMQGYAKAFRDPRLIEVIGAHADGVALALVLWSGPRQATTAIKWTIVNDEASSLAFADQIDATPRLVWGGSTALAYAIEYSIRELQTNGIEARRRVIDVSGDGKANDGGLPIHQRDRALALGITINGLAILNEEPDLKEYYEKYVIGGANAFVDSVWKFDDFADAILRKLIREIQGSPVAARDAPTGIALAAGAAGAAP
jgi:hypothetical protein